MLDKRNLISITLLMYQQFFDLADICSYSVFILKDKQIGVTLASYAK